MGTGYLLGHVLLESAKKHPVGAAIISTVGVLAAIGAFWQLFSDKPLIPAIGDALGDVAVGLGGAVALSKVFESRLFGVTWLDPASYVMATLVLVSVALVATLIPARRATGVDPVDALRYE